MHLGHIVEHAEVRHLGWVRWLVAHPDPDRLVLLDDGIAMHPGAWRNVLVTMRIERAGAGRAELEPVIGALHTVAVDDLAHAQRREPVRAAVLQRDDAAVRLAV